ncbi:MAG: baseplate J/gp47 family protein [Patescibacteria group bacterium]
MNKDVIYIDVEDDITAIISKVKASKEKIVALVPPKRIGVLQSAVNLRLLARSAEQSSKRLVVITSNHALMSLAATASLPVAKNLQSKPELAPIAALDIDDGDDVIDGNDLPIGDHARQSEDSSAKALAAAPVISAAQLAQPPKPGEAVKPRAKSGAKVPNFNTFRKKLVVGIIAGLLLIAFLVWAIIFAPRATIVVSAKTSDSSINSKVTVGDKLTTDLARNSIKATKVSKSEKKTIDFGASGSKNAGEKATGTVRLSQQSQSSTSVPAGTELSTDGGLTFTTTGSVVVPASTFGAGCFPTACPGVATVSVSAPEGGAKYNAALGGLSGAPSGVSANLQNPTSGGTDKIVKVVTAEDVEKAKEALSESIPKEVESQMTSQLKNAKAIKGSYRVDYTEVKATPDVGAESESGNAVLAATIVHSLYGLSDAELKKYLDAYLKKQLSGNENQRVYENGSPKAEFQDVTNNADGAELTLIATAKVGPRLDENDIKQQSVGRKTGEIQESLQSIQNIQDVEVKYFPFWVSSVPNDEKKVNVQFKVDDAN